MPTEYVLIDLALPHQIKKVTANELFDGRLEKFGVREHVKLKTKNTDISTSENTRCLTDGDNYLWVFIDDAGFVEYLTLFRPGGVPRKILNAIAEATNADVFSEHQPQYWGFATQEEWDAEQDKRAKEADDEFYVELLKFVQGKPNDIKPNTIGKLMAKDAKKLVKKDPTLLTLEKKDELLRKIKKIFEECHTVKVMNNIDDLGLGLLGCAAKNNWMH
jgi:hypothetical protein